MPPAAMCSRCHHWRLDLAALLAAHRQGAGDSKRAGRHARARTGVAASSAAGGPRHPACLILRAPGSAGADFANGKSH